MKDQNAINFNRLLGAALILSCIFSNLFPFLNIDLKIMELTLLRGVLFSVSLYCGCLWVSRIFRNRSLPGWKAHKTEWMVLCYFLLWSTSGLVWLLFFNSPETAATEVIGIISVFLYAFCFFTLVKGKQDVLFHARLCVSCGILLALMADVEIVVGSLVKGTKSYYTLEERVQMQQTLFPPSAVFHNPNDLATFLLMCLSIVAFRFIGTDKRREMAASAGAALVLLSPMPIINSTLFTLAFIFLGVITVGLLLFRREKNGITRWCKAAGLVLLVVLYLFPFSAFVKDVGNKLNRAYFTHVISQHYAEEDETASFSFDFEDNDSLFTQVEAAKNGSGTIHTRYWLIRAGLDYAGQHPIFGCGPGGFRTLMKADENVEYLKKARGMVDPHNFYIELLAQYGSVVFLGYLGILLYMLVSAMKRTAGERKAETVGVGTFSLLLLIMFSICAIIPSSIIRLTPLWLFFLLGVSALGCSTPTRER